MDSGNVVGSNGNLSTNPANIPGEGNHSVSGKPLNTLPSLASESPSDRPNQFGLIATSVAPLSTDWPQTLNENKGTGSLRPESNQTFPVVEPGLGITTNSDLTTSFSTALAEDDFSAMDKNLGPSSLSTASFLDDPFQLHINGTSQTNPPVSTSGSSKLDEDNGLGLLERISVKEPGYESKPSTDMLTFNGASFYKGDPSTPAMKLSESPTSSSAAGFSSKNPFEVSTMSDSTGPQKFEDTNLSSDNSDDDDILDSDLPKNEDSAPPAVLGHHSELSTGSNTETQSPPVQMMERPGDANTPEYKLPSYVFARTSTTAPMEWSVTSNESLFSIHMGNMSFTGDQLYFLGKSGELGKPGDPSVSPLIDYSSNQPPPREKSTAETGQKSGNLDEGLGATEAKAAETMREVIRENAENQKKEDEFLAKGATVSAVASPSGTSPSASLSHHSEGSTKSFAFPILSGDDEKNLSMRSGVQKQTHQHTPTQSQPVTPKETPAEAPNPKAATNVPPAKWLSCFSCCPFCS
ncbi:hypothetical protein FEM48_Zijuj05G0192700 [Ziziphus jujuba var. spinosa]|uniref:Uncharacterized protein n=1 Tax=Ziziphus jujuba var. spinosa TaxID=714518 RepID=A0A978VGN1_ZIZJJ|nr:hypothetical protein FEM48_Zijuj05G0192700 [Ziziphus jujuba var. spinosa]